MTETPYDTVAYPSAIFLQTHPNRLAMMARMHGLSAPDVETARVLEIGGGDGMNVIAMAAAYPRAQFLNVDLAAVPVAKGAALIAAAGLTNVRSEAGDILDLRAQIAPGSYDYIIAHGVYAWVPEIVRDAIMALIGHALSPQGLAFVSYNAMPGGHIRLIMREMLIHALEGIEGYDARIAAAQAFLTEHEKPKPDDDGVIHAMRRQSEAMLTRPPEGLFHDEMGGIFAPQSLTETVAAAAAHGLEFLNDAGTNRTKDGLLSEGEAASADPTAQVVRRAQSEDYDEMRFFRQTLLMRAGRNPARRPDLTAVRSLWIAGHFEQDADGGLRRGDTTFVLRDADLTAKLLELDGHWPRYIPLGSLFESDAHVEGMLELWHTSLVFLSTVPERFTLDPGAYPCASPLVRAQIAAGADRACSLSHEVVSTGDPVAQALLRMCDGSRDRAALAAFWDTQPHHPDLTLDRALKALAAERMMIGLP